MKKVMYLCLMLATMPFVSCGNDDDNNGEQDQIVGTWNYSAFEGEEPISNCNRQSTAEFKADGTYSYEFFYDNSGECTTEGVKNGQWEKTENGSYKGTYMYDDEEVVDVIMEVNKNTLKIKYSYVYAKEEYTDVWVYTRAK